MFAQVARFKAKEDSLKHIKNEIAVFRRAIKAEGLRMKSELVLNNPEHHILMAIALFYTKKDLKKIQDHTLSLQFLENLKKHIDGQIILYEAEAF